MSDRYSTVKTQIIVLVLLVVFVSGAPAGTFSARVDPSKVAARYNVEWDSPSKDYNGSMPAGNGDIGVNAWVEESGDLLLYIGKIDSWDDNGRLLKVGRVRISLTPPPPRPLADFRQVLRLPDGTIAVHYGTGKSAVDLALWVDANRPVIQVDVASATAIRATASIEIWRTTRVTLPSIEVSDIMLDRRKPDSQHEPTVVEPDVILTGQQERIGWYHHNVKSVGPELCARIQGLVAFKREDPLLYRTFGAVIDAKGSRRVDDLHLESPSSKQHRFSIAVLTQHPSTPARWLKAVEKVLIGVRRTAYATRRKEHEDWWKTFWSRSWVSISTANESLLKGEAFTVSQGYALQRYMNACAGRGSLPIKFNGSIFTVPYPPRPGDADYRQWGPGYWWQNTRLAYYTMCAAGDYDLMGPLFKMYGRDLMPLFRYRTERYFGHSGAFIPECIYFWGDVFTETYGWTPFEQRTDKLQESRWHKWEWVSGLELVFLMQDYYAHTLDGKFLKETLLPTAFEILTFFDQHYATDAAGKLVMTPSQSLETWWECTNPTPEIAGLHSVTDRLLALPEGKTTGAQREFWKQLKAKLPDLPTRMVGGKTMLAPAAQFANKMNIENGELYPVFPFRLFSFEQPNVTLAIEALRHRWDGGNSGWRQDDVFMAYLGLGDSAKAYLVGRAAKKHEDSRFPAFWGPNYDWIPDQDHGGILLKTVQSMLLQTDGKKIFLLPAWPKEWNAEFRLHAPGNTVVAGTITNGKLVELEVTPAKRRNDVVVMPVQ